ncbi:DUF86 domain-containing protein [Thermosulfurimonas marina]|uniref:DUF86 domain-containing protein n=2 Tax=Thermosulfurimonas marina TaxID=2047767 RepID=A0A6H1WUX0_9BACT|nr:DUF86 domain-containing protein [Thermosulfurimonas marina]
MEGACEEAQRRRGRWEYEFFRDSAIQRFEFTFELFWKALKLFLAREGRICSSPRACIREFFSLGYVEEEEARELLEMVTFRNLTVHTYQEETAEEVFRRLTGYGRLMRKALERMREEVKKDEAPSPGKSRR